MKKSSIIVLGNNMDSTDEAKVLSDSILQYIKVNKVDQFSNVTQNIKFFKTSAKTGENVDQAFSALGKRIIELYYLSKGLTEL